MIRVRSRSCYYQLLWPDNRFGFGGSSNSLFDIWSKRQKLNKISLRSFFESKPQISLNSYKILNAVLFYFLFQVWVNKYSVIITANRKLSIWLLLLENTLGKGVASKVFMWAKVSKREGEGGQVEGEERKNLRI